MIARFRASFARFVAILVKEFIQIRRDRLTFAMMFWIPILQLTLFGYAINADPKNLPTAIRIADQSAFARSLVRALENSGYFRIVRAMFLVEEEGKQFLTSPPPVRSLGFTTALAVTGWRAAPARADG